MANESWSDQIPLKRDAGDVYYFVRRKDRNEVVVMGFSMGQAWLNGVAYEPSQLGSHLFLGPLTPEDFEETRELERIERELNDTGVPKEVWIGTDSTADRVTWLITRNKLNQQNSRSRFKAMNALANVVRALTIDDAALREEAEAALIPCGKN